MTSQLEINKVVEDNIDLVYFSIKKVFANTYVKIGYSDEDDFFQVGCIGLFKAAKDFKPELGFKFSTYAISKICGEIFRELRDNSTKLKFPRSIKILGNKIKRNRVNINSVKDIISYLNIDMETAKGVYDYLNLTCQSLENDVKGTDNIKLKDSINGGCFEQDLLKELELEYYLDKLTERQKETILLYLEGYTQREIAEKLNISQVQVSRHISKSLKVIEAERENKVIEKHTRYSFRKKYGKTKRQLFVEYVNNNKSKDFIMEELFLDSNTYWQYYKMYVS